MNKLIASTMVAASVAAGGLAVAAVGPVAVVGARPAAVSEASPRHGHRILRAAVTTAAEAIGISPRELAAELREGRSIAEVASAEGVELVTVTDALTAKATAAKAAAKAPSGRTPKRGANDAARRAAGKKTAQPVQPAELGTASEGGRTRQRRGGGGGGGGVQPYNDALTFIEFVGAHPVGTKVSGEGGVFTAEGPKGTVSQSLFDGYPVQVDGDVVTVARSGDSPPERSMHGLLRALLANAVAGAATGFKKELDIIGVGYKAEIKGDVVQLALGYSHPVEYVIQEGVTVTVDKQTHLVVTGIDRQKVGQVAAEIHDLRPPDPYKQKGIRYVGEVLKKKAGKAGATGATGTTGPFGPGTTGETPILVDPGPLVEGHTYGVCAFGKSLVSPPDVFGPTDAAGSCDDALVSGKRTSTIIDRTRPSIQVKVNNGAALTRASVIPVRIDYTDNLAFPFPANFVCLRGGLDPATAKGQCDSSSPSSPQYAFDQHCSSPGVANSTPGSFVNYFICNVAAGTTTPDGPVTFCAIAADAAIPDNPSSSNQSQTADKANLSFSACGSTVLDRTAPGVVVIAPAGGRIGETLAVSALGQDATSGLAGEVAWAWGDDSSPSTGAGASSRSSSASVSPATWARPWPTGIGTHTRRLAIPSVSRFPAEPRPPTSSRPRGRTPSPPR